MISFECPHCSSKYRVQPELAGKSARCKQCNVKMTIPSPPAPKPVVKPAPKSAPRPASKPAPKVAPKPVKVEEEEDVIYEATVVSTPASTAPRPATSTSAKAPSISAPVAASREASATVSLQEYLNSIRGPIRKVPLTMQYRVGLILSALLMLLLPVIYLGLIIAVAVGVVMYAIHGVAIFQVETSGRKGAGLVIAYVAPLIIGSILVLFMIKPLFAGSAKRTEKRWLSPQGEPKLFAFIEKLCESVHAPTPKRIDVDCDVNASASFRHGIWSMFGNDMVLTIGMPLVAGLNSRELAGVLAHEFGHFSQGFGMRLSYIIRSINFWFMRVVYQRDSWDETLERWSQAIDLRLGLILYLARFFIWLTRRILWALMMLGHLVCSYLMRQMEYDADLHECRFSGSDTFESTAQKLRLMSIAFHQALDDQNGFFLDGKLCNDLPGLMLSNLEALDPELKEEILKSAASEKTEWLASHPSDRDRIAAARKENAPGVFRREEPASNLFVHYHEILVGVTTDYLKAALDDSFRPEMLVELSAVSSQLSMEREGSKAMGAIFGKGTFRVMRPINFLDHAAIGAVSGKEALHNLKVARERMLGMFSKYIEQEKELDQLDDAWIMAHRALTFLDLGVSLEQKQFDFPVTSAAVTRQHEQQLRAKQGGLSDQMFEYEFLFAQRAQSAVALLGAKQVADVVDNAAELQRASYNAIATLDTLRSYLPQFFIARNSLMSISLLLGALTEGERNEKMEVKMLELCQSMRRAMVELHGSLQQILFPFDHPDGEISLANYLVPRFPKTEDFGDVATCVNKLISQYQYLYFRCLGTLALACVSVEKGLKFSSEQ